MLSEGRSLALSEQNLCCVAHQMLFSGSNRLVSDRADENNSEQLLRNNKWNLQTEVEALISGTGSSAYG